MRAGVGSQKSAVLRSGAAMRTPDPLVDALGYWFASWTEASDMWEVRRIIAARSSEEEAARWFEAARWGCRVGMAYQRMFGESIIDTRPGRN